MPNRTKARPKHHEVNGDSGAVVSTQNPDGGWQITCPDCGGIHRAAVRLCPACTQRIVHQLRLNNRRLVEANDRLRDLSQELRHQLFQLWHAEAVAAKKKQPALEVEKRWSKFLTTLDF